MFAADLVTCPILKPLDKVVTVPVVVPEAAVEADVEAEDPAAALPLLWVLLPRENPLDILCCMGLTLVLEFEFDADFSVSGSAAVSV